MNISTDGMIAAIRSAAERVEPRESEVLNGIADRIAELVTSANKNRRTAKHYERECLEWQGKYNVIVAENAALQQSCVHVYNAGYNRGHLNTVDGISSCGDYEEDAFEALYEVISVPATILALNDVEASGVEKFAQHRHVQAFDVGVMADTGEISNILDFAARLREGAQ
ncbi:TPA: hypothetical protein PXN30_003698 [Yersinia enterocolitica]|uniref:hypothetical protein n=1 Tax=Yersinia TaxID=629 RepID=UPI0003D7FE83|nr:MULTISPECIES: hypothetical protein [Yersinia]AKF38555.1 hypothetical protein FORC2_2408 [Yersinia enterocolitica]ALG44862.1 hypothetical protein LI89_09020 [Yersinia enterocolitica]EKN3341722.1 hypothetical protein [Yersinia enterocolitica]EKN3404544.1 hypothetical protein [Yersinia enterocolitica]EKN3527336.1 hypothetical protein [Yersinia enterocolitica]